MQNRTENHNEVIVITKPDSVTEEQWAAIKSDTVASLDDLVHQVEVTRPHPTWCASILCEEDRQLPTPEDQGVTHRSRPVDAWTPTEAGANEITVSIRGVRHDTGQDWPDVIEAENTDPGSLGGIRLEVPDARRLAKALLTACELADRDPVEEGIACRDE